MEIATETQEELIAALKNTCKHIAFIRKKFLGSILHLTHPDVVNSSGHRCFIPACQADEESKLKTFWLMGKPPKKTYFPINYIGIGLHTKSQHVTKEWYTAYVPVNLGNFQRDYYRLTRVLIRIIEDVSFQSVSDFCKLSRNGSAESYFSENNGVTQTQDKRDAPNYFKFPLGGSNTREHCGIFATPSCMYATKNELATPLEFPGFELKLQVLIQVLVKPCSIVYKPSSITDLRSKFDACFSNAEIEWYISNTSDIVPDRLLFKLLRKDDPEEPAKPGDLKLLLVMPLTTSPLANPDFVTLSNLYGGTNSYDNAISIDAESNKILLRLKWTAEHNKTSYYLKSLIDGKNLEWDAVLKCWKINDTYMFEAVKFAAALSLKISDVVLQHLWKWLTNLALRGMPCEFSRHTFLEWLNSTSIWTIQRILITFGPKVQSSVNANPIRNLSDSEWKENLEVRIMPYNKDVVTTFKKRNTNNATYTWNREKHCWTCQDFKILIGDLMGVLPSLKPYSLADSGILENRGLNINLKSNKRQQTSSDDTIKQRVKLSHTEIDDDFDTVTKILLTIAADKEHIDRLTQKIQTVIETIAPPTSSISATGKIIMGGAGTGGIAFIESPRDLEIWNKMSLCIVPNELDGKIPVSQYNCNLLASLVGEVFILKERAIDHLMENYKQWPGPHDAACYARWNQVMLKNEPKCWGGLTFDGRQSLAQSRLFCDEDFYIQGDKGNQLVETCRLLVQLGNGKITNDPKEAEYVVITDKHSQEAIDLYKRFGKNDEDKIAATHGARHSTLVTPKYIYDCIIKWQLSRPQHCHQHYAF